jgi:hypothetical protein
MSSSVMSRLVGIGGSASLGPIGALVLALASGPAAAAPILPEGPRAFVDTAYAPPIGGRLIVVAAGDDLQSALDQADPGDIIQLEAGATFTGNFVLPAKAGAQWIHVRSSAHGSLPPPGTRVGPVHAGLMPRIVSPNTQPALATEFGAHHYRFVGIEITTTFASRDSTLQNLILLGYDADSQPATSLAQLPHDITFDRCYIHGTPTGNVLRGLAANSTSTAVVDSYLADFHAEGSDSQAIAAWNGPGPFKVVNNYLEAAAENVLFGGADPAIVGLVPSDIEVRHNYFFKPLAWKEGDPSYAGILWTVKNHFELKNAQRVLVDGNVFVNVWAAAQAGFAIQLTVRNQDGTAPWSVVQDVTFTHNVLRHVGGGVNILGLDDNFPSQQTARILIRDNLFADVTEVDDSARLFQILSAAAHVTIDHNTAFQAGPTVVADGAPSPGFTFTNNIVPEFQGVVGSDTGAGLDTLAVFFPGFTYARNVQPGGDPAVYPPDNFFPASLADVGFVDLAGGDYRLAATSPFKNAGTDGKDIGADLVAVAAATAGALDGVPPDPPAPPPVVAFSIKTPRDGAVVRATIPVRAGAGHHPAVASVRFLLDGHPLGLAPAPPFVVRWNTRFVLDGPHTLRAIALDQAETPIAVDSVTVMVANPAPTVVIVTPVSGAAVQGKVRVRAAVTHRRSVARLQFQLNGQDFGPALEHPEHAVRWDTTIVPNGPYTWTAIITTLAGARIVSEPVTVMVANPAPTVRIAKPKPGSVVKGKIQIAAAVTHHERIATLQFQLDGKNLGPALSNGESKLEWDSDSTPVGSHVLTAVLTTLAGDLVTSPPVVVNVVRKK